VFDVAVIICHRQRRGTLRCKLDEVVVVHIHIELLASAFCWHVRRRLGQKVRLQFARHDCRDNIMALTFQSAIAPLRQGLG
jgi:hypothetical protein